MYSYGTPHMAVQKQDDQHEHTFSSCVRIRDVVLRTCLGRWTIGRSGERGSGISVLPARHDDDNDDYYFTHLRLFHTSVTWWFFTRIWVTTRLLKSLGLLVFRSILIMQWFGWSLLVLLFLTPSVLVSIFWWLYIERR